MKGRTRGYLRGAILLAALALYTACGDRMDEEWEAAPIVTDTGGSGAEWDGPGFQDTLILTHDDLPPVPAEGTDTVRVVHGTAEIDLGRGRFSRAGHVRAVLENAAHRQETLVGRDGEFFFERVPAGTYRLRILPLRGAEAVATTEVVVEAGETLRLPHVRIPQDAIVALPQAAM